jgi:hypothetical protein
MTRFLILPTTVAFATLAISACGTTSHRPPPQVQPQVTVMPTPAPTPTPKPVSTAPPPPPAVKDIQVAKPVAGKPGFVTLPGSSGLIDVRGFSPGEQVKDPATGQLFLVP